jgi:hypothetical protein
MRKIQSWLLSLFVMCLMLSGLTSINPVQAATGTPVITVSSASYTSLRISWEPVFGAKGYVISRATSSTGTYTQIAEVVDTDHYVDTGLTFNKYYYYKVKAYALVEGVKVFGADSAAKYNRPSLPAVTGQSVVSSAYNANTISWSALTGATGYQVYYSKGTSTSFVWLKTVTGTSTVHTGLTTATSYNYKIRAYRLVGTTAVYGPFSAVASNAPIPGTPTNLNVVSGGFSSLKATWTAVSGANGYEISIATVVDGTYTVLPLVTSASATLNGLLINQTYYVRVRAFRIVGTTRVFGAYSAIDSAKPVPIAPTLSVTSTAFDSLRISWPVVSGTTAYELYVLNPGSSTYELLTTTSGNSYISSGLTTGQLYSFKAKAYSQVGDEKVYGPDSSVVAARPVPQAVTGWVISMPGVTTMSLAWNAVVGATGYDITRATSSGGTYYLVASVEDATNYVNTGLTFYRYYYYKIRPYTTVNGVKVYGALSGYVYARTIPSTPQVNVTNTNSKTNVISWAPVSGAQGYVIYYAKGTSTTYTALRTVTSTSTTHTGVALNSSYKYRVRAYRTYGTTRIYSAYSTIQTVLVQYSTDELLAIMSSQLNALLSKVTSQPVKDIILFTKGSIDATRLDPTHDYRADVLTAKIMFHGLTTSQKAEILLAVILNINGSIIQLLDQRFDVD